MGYIMRMDVGSFIQLVLSAKEQERKEQIQRQWTSMLPFMSMQYLKYVSFDEYYNICTGANVDMRSNEEIIADILETHEKAHKKKEGE